MEERLTFKITNEQGADIECEALFTFESEETGKNYMVYTDHSKDEEGNTKIYAATYTPGQEQQTLLPIETEKEWKVIETILDEVMKEVGNGQE